MRTKKHNRNIGKHTKSWWNSLTAEERVKQGRKISRAKKAAFSNGRVIWNKGKSCPRSLEAARRAGRTYRKRFAAGLIVRTPEHARAIIRSGKLKPNKAEKKLHVILNKKFPGEFRLNVKGGFVLDGKVPDFVNVNGKKMVVELFGRHWHEPFEEEIRKKAFSKYGFNTLIVWEEELKNEKALVTKIDSFLGKGE